MRHREWHRTERIGWLRAAVLGANDGIVSTASRRLRDVTQLTAARAEHLVRAILSGIDGSSSIARKDDAVNRRRALRRAV